MASVASNFPSHCWHSLFPQLWKNDTVGPKGNGLKVWLRVLNFKPAIGLPTHCFSVVSAGFAPPTRFEMFLNHCTHCQCEPPFSLNQLIHPHTIWETHGFLQIIPFWSLQTEIRFDHFGGTILPLSNSHHWPTCQPRFGRQFAKRLQRNRCR